MIRTKQESRIEIISAERTLIRLLHPLLDAATVIDVLARQLFDELVLLEPLDADHTGLGAFLHDQRLDLGDPRRALALQRQTGKHYNL